jgi:hypothetical protein
MAYQYCYNALASTNSATAATAAARIATGVNENLRRDLNHYSQFFFDNQSEKSTKFADKVNDTYLKTSGDEEGIASYGQVCDLLVSWHIQEVVLPAQKEEAESTFDPYDENQVDLSGIVGTIKGD